MLLSRLAACVLALGVTTALPALAQPAGDLPVKVIESPRLTDDDLKQITAFIERFKAQLANEKDRNGVKVARMRLIEPLTNANVSVDFRIKYSEALVPVLDPLVRSEHDFIASNATQILGELATPRALDPIGVALADKREAVRFSAAYSCQRVFENLTRPSPGLTSVQASAVIDTVVARVSKEEDANVAQALVMALEAATEIPSAQLKDVRAYAVTSAAKSIAARAKAMDGKQEIHPSWRQVLWRANRLTRSALTQAPANEPRLSDEALKQVGGLAGHTMALVLRRMNAPGGIAPDERALLSQTVALAEASYYFAYSNKGGNPVDARLGKLVEDGDVKKFTDAVMEIIGPKKPLTSSAFGFPDDEFVPGKP